MKIETLKKRYEEYHDHWADQHERITKAIRFCRDGDQWDEGDKRDRDRESRPCLTINKIPSFARQVINDARQNKPAIKTHPADDMADVKTSEIMNGIIRQIEYQSDAEVCYDTALESAVYTSWGFWQIDVDYTSFDQFDRDILFKRILDPTTVYPDPYSETVDATDWTCCFVDSDPISETAFKKAYPKADMVSAGKDHQAWNMPDGKVLLVTAWVREEKEATLVRLNSGSVMLQSDYEAKREEIEALGLYVEAERPTVVPKVTRFLFSGEEILEEEEWPGRYIPVIPVYGEDYVCEGERKFKSMFDDAWDSQRSYNYWRTSSAEMVALQPKTPYVGPVGAFNTDGDRWATVNQDNWPYLEYDGEVPPQRQQSAQLSPGAIQETQSADQDMRDIVGIQQAALGMQSNEISGVAVDSRKAESDTANFHFIDNLARSMRYCGRVLIDLIPRIYDAPKVMRIIGYDDKPETVAINGTIQGYEQFFDLTKGKYDLTVQMGASYTTKRKEAIANMMDLVTSFPEVSRLIGDLVAKNMDWEGADEIAKRLKTMLPPSIAAMENMEGVPEEAKPFIARAMQSEQQVKQQLQERDMIIQQGKEYIQQLEVQIQNKQGDLSIKAQAQQQKAMEGELDRRHEMQMAVIEGTIKAELEKVNTQLNAVKSLVNNQLSGGYE